MPKQTFFNLPDQKRQNILEMAVEEFGERGYKQASISAIVAKCKIAKGSFYQYFEDKDDLYAYIVHTMIAQRKLANFEREKHRLQDLSLTQFLRLVFQMQVEEFSRNPALIKIGIDLMSLTGEPVYQRLMGRYQNMLGNYFSPFIQHEIDQGEIDPGINVQLLNFMLVSLGQYLVYQYQSTGIAMANAQTVDKLVDDLEYILANGIYQK